MLLATTTVLHVCFSGVCSVALHRPLSGLRVLIKVNESSSASGDQLSHQRVISLSAVIIFHHDCASLVKSLDSDLCTLLINCA